ncbi:MAG: glycosyltransferase [Phycisphaeraceae bacterium]|nr:glycosyltransferase [Phycisphaeraceae bacterium]
MRILMLNWAPVWEGARKGGISGYTQALALELAARGHRVATLASGTAYPPLPDWRNALPGPIARVLGKSDATSTATPTSTPTPTYTPAPTSTPAPCQPRRHDDWMGIAVYEIVGSPVLAPSLLQFNEPLAEVCSPQLEAAFARVLAAERPDVLHVQSLEGFSIGCIDAALAAGCRVVYSLHNYHPLCPQVYLMRGHRTVCGDSQGGRACRGCVPAPEPAWERARRAAAWPAEPPAFDACDQRPSRPPAVPLPVLGQPLEQPARAADPDTDARGMSALLRAWQSPDHWFTPQDPTWQPFDNIARPEPTSSEPVSPEPASEEPATDYARRRAAFVEALNRCQAVHAVSSFVADKFVAHGVDARRVRTITIGTIAGRLAERNAELVFDPPPRPTPMARPLRLVFIGANHWYKGLSMLADSLDLLTPEVLGKVALTVYAAGGRSIEYRFRRLEPRLASLRYGGEYQPQDVPWICGGQDAGVVPSVWWDNGPQTVLEMQASGLPVLGARAGGIPDFVRDGFNGLLFTANDRFDLARTIARCVDQPALVERLRAGVRPPKPMDLHATEVEALYRAALAHPGGMPAAPVEHSTADRVS